MPAVTWDSKLRVVAGSAAPKIEKAFGYLTVGELLTHYPRRYVEKGSVSDLGDLTIGDQITCVAMVLRSEQRPYQDKRTGRRAYRLEVTVATERDTLTLTFFDRTQHTASWRASRMKKGSMALFSGKVGRFRDGWQLVNPQTEVFEGDDAVEEADLGLAAFDAMPDLVTLYPATASLHSWQIQKAIHLALAMIEEVPEPLPEDVRRRHDLVDARTALEWIHRPDSVEQRRAAEERLRFQEAFVTQVVLAGRRQELRALAAEPRTGRPDGLLDRFDARLPFTLTAGQEQVSAEILGDLAAGHPMHRLLQGEVGSGKTVVALRAMLRVVDSGGQAALLAPTEVLAQQHHRSVTALLGDLAAGGMLGGAADATTVALLTGSSGAAARRSALLDAASGAAGIVIGTHALLEERVQFADLGLVVVDEQHRFGVEQRAALAEKAGVTPPHVLVMTATPIPRTVAMTVFGDLETSTLSELPGGRAPIQTTVVPLAEQPAWIDRVWARVREEVEAGRQCYVVCPRIGDDARRTGEETGSDEAGLTAVEELAPMLATGPLDGLRVEPLHGRQPADRKEHTMRDFAAGRVDVLVSTTVIEVGVDVANATAMVIFDADRFGVSQLHQLRGRVGRGGHAGLCLLVTSAEQGSPARERVGAVAATTDGFELSRLDLEQRREGDVLGASQSGTRSGLRLLSVLRDEDVIARARAAAETLVEADPTLGEQPDLRAAVQRLRETEQADFLEKA
ncbi:ATP-dependent DNA helicase RecG [Nocardioides mesophilus]|uniref:ATP-dependent DNA helicase RecG n=1 Tax=Nocardioides mesophilus TaxID=433659 RepID=A0A7G9R923_9ACTN|nr:ATP-dependent DNA helicase RecG [Nocardioides mesophilus]QNN52098.1 ATP-dependent DNA helicase RecG [Nocardioides mesophilus]